MSITTPLDARDVPAPRIGGRRLSELSRWTAHLLGQEKSQDRVNDPASNMEEVASNVGLSQSAASKSDPRLSFASGKAAVLVCLFQNAEREIRVILTKRAQPMSSHSGEVALPGGKKDEEDADDVATALREAREEIGLDPSLVTVLTVLEPFVSKKLIRVTPVIGLLFERSMFDPCLNRGEVDAIFDAPLDMFLKDEQHRSEEMNWLGHSHLLHYFDYESSNEKYLIWGLTAAILIRCASFIYQRAPAFNELHPALVSKTAGNGSKL